MNGTATEINFDGLVGPTHNYAGLACGNLASQRNRASVSNPREAALQGLAKMKFMADLGVPQAVLPPQARPDLDLLRRVGFGGSEAAMLARARREAPRLLAAAYSASAMWAANAATVSPAADALDGRLHVTPANLVTQVHRSIEPAQTSAILSAIFRDPSAFTLHAPLPATAGFADEGAANHTRLCDAYGSPGVEMFVYGRDEWNDGMAAPDPAMFPARQTSQAAAAVARLHALNPAAVCFVRQSPRAIDAGAFHNDVVAVGNRNVLLYHASAYVEPAAVMAELRAKFADRCAGPLHLIEVSEAQVSLADAIDSYLFNSQLVTLPDGSMSLIAPIECRERPAVERFIRELLDARTPIRSVHFLDVRQSMRNGGGPACLRLRVVLDERARSLAHPGVFWSDQLFEQLTAWVQRHHRETLTADDLADPQLAEESRAALDELTRILGLGTIYPFQR